MNVRPPSGSSDHPKRFTSRPSSSRTLDLRVVTLATALEGDPLPPPSPESKSARRAFVAPVSPRAFTARARPSTTLPLLPIPSPDRATTTTTTNTDSIAKASIRLLQQSRKQFASTRGSTTRAPLGSWPSSLPVPVMPPAAQTEALLAAGPSLRSLPRPAYVPQQAAVSRGAAHVVERILHLSPECPRAAAVLKDAVSVLQEGTDVLAAVEVAEVANFSRPDGAVEYAVHQQIVLPLQDTFSLWQEMREDALRVADAVETQVATLKEQLKEFLSTDAIALDAAVAEVEAPNPALIAAQRRYNLVHDRQAATASAALGLHDAKAKLESLTRLNLQLESEVRSCGAEILRGEAAAKRAIERNTKTAQEWKAKLDAEMATLKSLCNELDFAEQSESALAFRIASEKARAIDIEQDVSYWRSKLDTGVVERNDALTPRPSWRTLDVAQWGIKYRDPAATEVDAPDTDELERVLRSRRNGGSGFASAIEQSTSSAIDTLWARFNEQQRVAKKLLEELASLRRATSNFVGEHLATAATFSLAAIPSFLGKGETISLRSPEGIVLPVTPWSTDRLACVSSNAMRAVCKYLTRNAHEDSVMAAVNVLLAQSAPPSMAESTSAAPSPARRESLVATGGRSGRSASLLGDYLPETSMRRAMKSVATRVKALAAMSTSLESVEDTLLGNWHWLPSKTRGSAASKTTPELVGADTVARILQQLQAQCARATLESNPIAFAAAEAFAGRLSPRIFLLHAQCMERVASIFTALDRGEQRRNGALPLAAAETIIRKGCGEVISPAAAARVALQATRGPHGSLEVSLRQLSPAMAQAAMMQLLQEQRRLVDIFIKAVVSCCYHGPTPSTGASGPFDVAASSTGSTRVWLYAAELEALTVECGGWVIKGPPVNTALLVAKATFEQSYAANAALPNRESPSPPASPKNAAEAAAAGRKVLRFNLPSLLDHMTAHVTSASLRDVFPQIVVTADSGAHDDAAGHRKGDVSSALKFAQLHEQAKRDAPPPSIAHLVDRQRGKGTLLPNPDGLRLVRSRHEADGRGAQYSSMRDDHAPELYDASEVVAKLRSLCLMNYIL